MLTYSCELKTLPERPTVAVRTRAAVQDMPKVFQQAFGELMAYLGKVGEQPAGMPYGAYHNMDMQDLDVEIGFPVSRELDGEGEIRPSKLPGGRWASTMHVGPYDQLSLAYEALMGWVEKQGYEAGGAAYEFYLSGPEVPPEQIKTEVAFPLTST